MRNKRKTYLKVLRHFVYNHNSTIQELADSMNVYYTTAMRRLSELHDYIELKSLRPSKRGKNQRVYEIKPWGLVYFFLMEFENVIDDLGQIAEKHKYKLLTFKYWKLFQEKGLEEIIKKRFFASISSERVYTINRLFMDEIRPFKGEGSAYGIDYKVLGFDFMNASIETTRSLMNEEDWMGFLKIWELVSEIDELRRTREEHFFLEEQAAKEKLRNIEHWRNFSPTEN
ncbi:MAG: hypothetical protein ACFFB3_20070 [Candidatus Hodarchaeota archaeon]